MQNQDERIDTKLMLWSIFWAVICVLAGVQIGKAPEGVIQWVTFGFLIYFTAWGAAHAIRSAWRTMFNH